MRKYQKRAAIAFLDPINFFIAIPQMDDDMHIGEIRQFCQLQNEGQGLMRTATIQPNLSARTYHNILKFGRIIADLAGSDEIHSTDLAEALQYRPSSWWGKKYFSDEKETPQLNECPFF